MLKVCGRCKIEKEASSENFHSNKAKKDGLQGICRECQKIVSKKHYEKNYAVVRERTAKRNVVHRNFLRQKLYDFYSKNPCVDCSESRPACLDLDHVRGAKRDNISNMIRKLVSWDTILEEIAKCEVRCANCHRMKTAEQFGWYAFLEQ